MSKPQSKTKFRKPLTHRMAKLLGIPLAETQWIFDHPNTPAEESPCWQWTRAVTGGHGAYGAQTTPIMWHNGALRPVRRVVYEALHGVELSRYDAMTQLCETPFCVQPTHIMAKPRRVDGTFAHEHGPENVAEDTLEDAAHAIYSRNPPWDAQQLADEFDYPVALMVKAIAAIERGEM